MRERCSCRHHGVPRRRAVLAAAFLRWFSRRVVDEGGDVSVVLLSPSSLRDTRVSRASTGVRNSVPSLVRDCFRRRGMSEGGEDRSIDLLLSP